MSEGKRNSNSGSAVSCRNTAKCYQTNKGKKCTKPNSWIIYPRTQRARITSIRRAARAYKKFRKSVVLRVIAEANENHALKKAKLPQTTVQVLMPFNESFPPFSAASKKNVRVVTWPDY